MKVVWEFDLNDPEQAHQYRRLLRAQQIEDGYWDFYTDLRGLWKHSSWHKGDLNDDQDDIVNHIWDRFHLAFGDIEESS